MFPPNMASEIAVQGNFITDCPDCGEKAYADKGTYTYDYGDYSYVGYFFEKTKALSLSKKQGKRAIRKIVKSTDPALLAESLATVDPGLKELAEEAVQSPNPLGMIKQLAAGIAFTVGLTLAGLQIAEKLGLQDEIQTVVDNYVNGLTASADNSPKNEKSTNQVGGSHPK